MARRFYEICRAAVKERAMNRYDARQQFIEGLEQYVAGIETAERLR
jgi:hypothetical protein